jgi:TolB protein
MRIFRRLLSEAVLLSCCVLAQSASAQTTIVVSDPLRKSPIALPVLCSQSGNLVADRVIPKTIARDLQLSGYFDVQDPRSYIEQPGACGAAESQNYDDWRVTRTEWLVKGVVNGFPGGGVRVSMYLHDVPGAKVAFAKEYSGEVGDIPLIAHRFANEIMRVVTGELGPWGSEILFSARVGRFKELFKMGADGGNVKQLTNERGLALSPAWHPTGARALYTSYRNRIPDLFIYSFLNKSTSQVTRGPSLEVGGLFTPQGTIITSSTDKSDSSLVELSVGGQILRQMTPPNRSIDVSPTLSPNGERLAFCSDRAGGPQIYIMSTSGGRAERISFVSSNYCTSPTWSPKGDQIAFVCRSDGGFQIYVAAPDGSDPIQLTSGGDNEDPDWSPDGRYLIYASTFGQRSGFKLALMRVVRNAEGSNITQISSGRTDDTQPAWGPRITQ